MPTTPSLHIRPLSETELTPELDGSQGTNRAPTDRLQIEAQNDVQAIACFLQEYDKSPETYRLYERNCERLMLWAIHECSKPVSSLTRQDFEGYLNFMADPQPAAVWCGKKADRASQEWRPFVGPMQEGAVLTSLAAINSLMKYLVDAGYVLGNPLGLIRQRRRKMAQGDGPQVVASTTAEADKIERYLDEEMWQAVNDAVEAMPRKTPDDVAEYERLRFVCALLYMLAPRIGELQSHDMSSFREERGLWWWHVVGKGGKKARIPVPDDMLQALVRYRKHLGLTAVPTKNDRTPLLCALRDPSQSIKARRLNQILKTLFFQAAELLPTRSLHKAEKLRQASAHWGRHTGITAKIDSGIEASYVQKEARHSDFRTTQRYIHAEEERWHAEAQKQRLPWKSAADPEAGKQP